MSGSRRSSGGPAAESETEKAKRKRKEAEQKNAQTAEGRAARASSRSASDDGLVEAAAVSKRRVSQASSPSPSPVSKSTTRQRVNVRGGTLESSSDDEEAVVAGAVAAGKTKLMRGSAVKSNATEVKLFKIHFLRSFFNSLIRDFSQRGVGSSKAVVVARSGQPKQSQGSPSADLTSQVQN